MSECGANPWIQLEIGKDRYRICLVRAWRHFGVQVRPVAVGAAQIYSDSVHLGE